MEPTEKNKILSSLFFPALFVAIMWVVKLLEIIFSVRFVEFGIYPRELYGLPGIITAPFIHGDFAHLFNNSLPVLILGTALFYFYRGISYKVFFLIYFITNLWLWSLGRPSYHIGASGLVYGLATFLFFSGIFRWNINLIVVSLLVTFLYGSLVWGILPIDHKISFEGHFVGSIAGIFLAIYYRKEGPQKKKYEWEEEKDNEDEEEDAYWKIEEQ